MYYSCNILDVAGPFATTMRTKILHINTTPPYVNLFVIGVASIFIILQNRVQRVALSNSVPSGPLQLVARHSLANKSSEGNDFVLEVGRSSLFVMLLNPTFK